MSRFTIIGENIHATRVLRLNGKRADLNHNGIEWLKQTIPNILQHSKNVDIIDGGDGTDTVQYPKKFSNSCLPWIPGFNKWPTSRS